MFCCISCKKSSTGPPVSNRLCQWLLLLLRLLVKTRPLFNTQCIHKWSALTEKPYMYGKHIQFAHPCSQICNVQLKLCSIALFIYYALSIHYNSHGFRDLLYLQCNLYLLKHWFLTSNLADDFFVVLYLNFFGMQKYRLISA